MPGIWDVIAAVTDWQEPLSFRGSRGSCGRTPVSPAPLHAGSCHTPDRTTEDAHCIPKFCSTRATATSRIAPEAGGCPGYWEKYGFL